MANKDEVVETLNKLDCVGTCQSCGNTTWMIYDQGRTTKTPSATQMILMEHSNSMTIPPAGIPLYTLVCHKCGFVRLHAVGIIDKLIAVEKESGNNER